jgi:vacuolar protein sorting-associated protein 13D
MSGITWFLGVVANQETVVELMGFFNRAFPNQAKEEPCSASNGFNEQDSPEYEAVGETWAVQTDIAAEFHCLNLLLVRDDNRIGSQSFGPPVGRKVSSICLSELCLQASLGRQIEVTGSVEGVAVLDQTQQGWLHRDIFKIGVVPGREVATKTKDDEDDGPQRAFSFELTKQTDKNQSVEKVTVVAKLAALHYLHTRTFLNELQLCVSDFRHFTLELATSLRTAAAGMAMGIVGQKESLKGGIDYLSKSFAGDTADETDGQFDDDTFDGIGEVEISTKVYLHIDIGSPVVLLPRASDSGEMFIAHLGHITASNNFIHDDAEEEEMDRLAVTVKDMHLFSCHIDTTEWEQESSMQLSLSSNVKQEEILHDTTLELEIDRTVKPVTPLAEQHSTLSDQNETDCSPSVSPLSVSGKVTTPLQVTLSKHVFKQALATLDFLTDNKAKDELTKPTVKSESGQDDISSAVNEQGSGFQPLVGSFTIPKVSVILRGVVASNQADVLTDERDIVEVSLEQFSLQAQKQERFITQLQVKLRGLLVDDLLQSQDTNLNHILSSYVAPGSTISVLPHTIFRPMHQPIGVQSLSQPFIKQPLDIFQSLPSASSSPLRKPHDFRPSLRSGHVFVSPIEKTPKDKDGTLRYWKELDLVNVKVLLVDKSSPKFMTEYESVSRFVDVDFNVLSAVVNLQTWVILLDFFGIGVPDQPHVSVPPAAEKPSNTEPSPQPVAPVSPEKPSMNVKVQVNALTLTLNKSQYPLAEASVSGLAATVLSRKEKKCVSGRLQFFCLSDISPNGNIYSDRLCTGGNKELIFDLVKYSAPDWELRHEFDVSVMLKVPTVSYIHTQHFLQETVAFCQHFVQIMDAYQRMKAAAADNLDYHGPTRSPRVLLDIEADSPLIMVPRSAAASDMFVIDLGHLRATNKFLFSGTEGTIKGRSVSTGESAGVTQSMKDNESSSLSAIGSDLPSSYGVSQSMTGPALQSPDAENECRSWQSAQFTGPCLLDCIDLSLSDMDVFTAKKERRQDEVRKSDKSAIVKNRGPMLADKCKLNLKIERNLCNDLSKAVPEFLIAGELSSVHILVDQFQLALIKDLLDHNLGEPLEEFERPESVIRDPVIAPIFDGVWTVIDLTIALVNVTVQLVLRRKSALADSRLPLHSLAQFELEESEFHVITRSNKSKTANLMSMAIRAFDIRQQGCPEDLVSNVFSEVLSPMKHNTANSPNSPQLEISYHMTGHQNRLAVVLHRARLVVLLDWLLQTKEFLLTKSEDLKQEDSESEEDTDEVDFHQPMPSSIGQFQIPKKESKLLDINLSVTDTDFVVVEDITDLHSNAVILKWTLVLTSKESDCGERSLNMSLSDMELFSCQLGSEDETALSIIDPASVSVSLEPQSLLSKSQLAKSSSHTDITVLPTLEISAHAGANIRLSYRDIELFLAILSVLKRQLQGQSLLSSSNETKFDSNCESEGSDDESPPVNSVLLSRLKGLGYPESLCNQALRQTGGDLNKAADWLVDNAQEVEMKEEQSKPAAKKIPVGSIDVRCRSLRVTVIDDCGDSDVPLVEVSVVHLVGNHDMLQVKPGKLKGTIQGECYNGNLGAWEPFLEPWSCVVEWSLVPNGRSNRRLLEVKADNTDGIEGRLELNLTSMLLETLKRTKSRWSEEYSKFSQQVQPHQQRRRGRAHFVPFILRNNSGCHLQFATSVLVPSKVSRGDDNGGVLSLAVASLRSASTRRSSIKQSMGSVTTSQWTSVAPGEECPFGYETHKKQRHHRSSTPQLYQLEVELDGWQAISPPVSVDKVGVFFRSIEPQMDGDTAAEPFTVRDKRPVRVVFAISVVGATKIINVRSGLVVHNKMDIPVELCVEHPGPKTADSIAIPGDTLAPIQPRTKSAIPLHLTLWNLRARPFGWDIHFSESTVEWKRVRVSRQQTLHRCIPVGKKGPTFKFCTSVQRDGFPQTQTVEPGHTIIIQPPVTVYNLLPVDMTVRVLKSGSKALHSVKPGKRASLYEIDPGNGLNFGVLLDGFPHCEDVFVPLARDYILRLCVYDSMNRPLWLYAKTEVSGKALKVHVLCPFWLENCTGLPLVFKNDHAQMEAAGQHEEHERARSVSPLLFSYSLPDLPNKCCVRIGKYCPTVTGKPLWSKRFRLEKADGDFIQVHVNQGHNRPDLIHEIGYTTRRGKGLYVDTMIVKFVTRFLLFNNSSHRLAYGQKYETHDTGTMPAIALPNSMTPYNWCRVDLEQLMCIRIQDIPDCHWSGGFKLNQDHSFHVIMRGVLDRSYFIWVQVSLKDATYHVVFSDAAHVPPPFRIENLSQVPVVFYQKHVVDTSLRRELKPQQSVPYAWDEPTLSKSLVLTLTDGSQQRVYNIDQMGEKEPLTYENYIYIAAEYSVPLSGQSRVSGAMQRHLTQSAGSELVLDVPQGSAVLFKRKETNRLSQLWRMTAAGQIEHMGSALTRKSERKTPFVLDITDESQNCITLVIRRLDKKRASTQTWKYDGDKRLSCGMPRMFVQPRGGITLLRDGSDAILSPDSYVHGGQNVPPEQALRIMKQKEGSGTLSVRVTPDGPTRVVRVVDKMARGMSSSQQRTSLRRLHSRLSRSSSVDSVVQNMYETSVDQEPDSVRNDFQVILRLSSGVGLSVINSVPEELCYVTLSGLEVNFLETGASQSLDINVQQIQADNQLIGAQTSALLYRTTRRSNRLDSKDSPVCSVNMKRIPSHHDGVEVLTKLEVTLRPITLQLDERLLLSLLQFGGFKVDDDSEPGQELLQLTDQLHGAFARPKSVAKLYYVDTLILNEMDLKLSVLTSKRLSEDLQAVKRRLPIMLVKFENANIILDAYGRRHLCDSLRVHIDKISTHYEKKFKGQAASIIGSVNFLGNPFGLLHDVTSGVSGVMTSGDIPGLVTKVAHGVTDSASKLTGTASSVLENLTMDEEYEARRARISEGAKSSGDHLVAGVKGLAHGVWGGLTSIVSRTYEGATQEGIGGLVTGLAKGVAGTVTKPAVGVLDFASGAAAAVSARTATQPRQPDPVRPRRYCLGIGGVLPQYSKMLAEGWDILLRLNDGNSNERLIAYEGLQYGRTKMRVIISSYQLYFFGPMVPTDHDDVAIHVKLAEVQRCDPISKQSNAGKGVAYYMQLVVQEAERGVRTKLIRCDTEEISRKVTQEINYAKSLHDEQKHMVSIPAGHSAEIW